MSQRNRITTTFFVGVTAAVLTLALPVEAQVPADAPATAPVVKPADTVNLSMEQRHVIKEIIIKDPNTEKYTIQRLGIFTQYLVSLQVYNPEGLGPSTTVVVRPVTPLTGSSTISVGCMFNASSILASVLASSSTRPETSSRFSPT